MEDIFLTRERRDDLWQDPYLHQDLIVAFVFWILHLTDVKILFSNSEVKQETIHEKNLMDYNSGSSIWQIFEIILMWRLFLQEIIFIAQIERELLWRNWNERLGSFTLLSLKFVAGIKRDISLTGQIWNWCASQFWWDKLQTLEHTNDL